MAITYFSFKKDDPFTEQDWYCFIPNVSVLLSLVHSKRRILFEKEICNDNRLSKPHKGNLTKGHSQQQKQFQMYKSSIVTSVITCPEKSFIHPTITMFWKRFDTILTTFINICICCK